jgi:predicted branched-subunit amino acid permease
VTSNDDGPTPHVEPPTYMSAQKPDLRGKGVFDPRFVRLISFSVISIALFGTALLCVLAIWDYASRDTAWRALATLGVLAATVMFFSVINEMFGSTHHGPAVTVRQAGQERDA